MDYFTLAKEAVFVKERLVGRKVQRAFQGDRGVSLKIKGAGYLNIVLDPDFSSFFLSEGPLFSEKGHISHLIDAHLKNALIEDLSHGKGERVFFFRIVQKDFVGRESVYELVFEVLGRASNLILCKDGVILDAWRRVEGSLEERNLLPARLYQPPVAQKRDFFILDLSGKELTELLASYGLEDALKKLYPLPRFLEKKIKSFWKGAEPSRLLDFLASFEKLLGELSSSYVWLGDRLLPFEEEGCEKLPVSEGICRFVLEGIKGRKLKEARNRLRQVVSSRLKRIKSLQKKLAEELDEANQCERYRVFGEAILINLSRIPEGKDVVELPDPYNEGEVLEIPMVKGKRPSLVAQDYFSLYSRLKSKKERVEKRLKELEAEEAFLEDLLWQIEDAEEEQEFEQLEELLVDEGYIKRQKPVRRPKHTYRYDSYVIEGYRCFVGRNSRANDYVTFKLASRDDIWLHAKGVPGAHVVVKGKEVPLSVVEKAASLAAYFSKARLSRKVDVDYTKVKFVRRMRPARPGLVLYTNFSTLTVEPKSPEEVVDIG